MAATTPDTKASSQPVAKASTPKPREVSTNLESNAELQPQPYANPDESKSVVKNKLYIQELKNVLQHRKSKELIEESNPESQPNDSNPSIENLVEITTQNQNGYTQSLLAQVPQFAQLCSKVYDIDGVKEFDKNDDEMSKWKFVTESRNRVFNTSGYYAQIWVNHETKQIALVSCGTKLRFKDANLLKNPKTTLKAVSAFAKDVLNDLQLALNFLPTQSTRGAIPFIELEMQKDTSKDVDKRKFGVEESKLGEYNIVCSGHSLGAALADASALYLQQYSDKFKSISSISMENPGSEQLLSRAAKRYEKRGILPQDFELDCLRGNFAVINNAKNYINAALPQFAVVYKNNAAKYKAQLEGAPSDTENNKPLMGMIRGLKYLKDLHSVKHFFEATPEKLEPINPQTWGKGLLTNTIASVFGTRESLSNKSKSISSRTPFASGKSTASSITSRSSSLSSSNSELNDRWGLGG